MTREEKEAKSLFTDPKFSRQAWQSVGRAILQHPATKAPEAVSPDGNLTIQSAIEQYSYDKLANLLWLNSDDYAKNINRPESILSMYLALRSDVSRA